jgi:PqqD family protein of HPr-rel-A system
VTTGCDLLWRFWDGEYVVFNTGSGDTHVLDAFSGEVLKSLQQCPATASEIAGRLGNAFAFKVEDVPAERLDQVLAEFHTLGLIESVEQ